MRSRTMIRLHRYFVEPQRATGKCLGNDVKEVVLSGRDHGRIRGAVWSAQGENLVRMAGVVQREPE